MDRFPELREVARECVERVETLEVRDPWVRCDAILPIMTRIEHAWVDARICGADWATVGIVETAREKVRRAFDDAQLSRVDATYTL